ncbi:MAG: papain-like cysteine peptidase [Rubritepida sp.]|jgi:hypothetical protein|nr:papain-like cysteine peptidase [Rubritepida sp.]MCU0946433.1 papain-like cysteine peptidase [Rubritepida sp.]
MPAKDPTPLKDVLEAVVRGSHLALLDRNVAPDWLEPFVGELQHRLKGQSLTDVTAGFIRVIATSDEAKTKLPAQIGFAGGTTSTLEAIVAPAVAARPSALACIGFGTLPAAAGLLRHAGLRRWAGPFDWMSLPAEAVRDSLVDDFSLLLLPSEHQPIPANERPADSAGYLCRHARFSELYGPTIFHVADPTTPEGYAALERGVLRLREALRGLHGKLLFQLVEEDRDSARVFAETAEFLDRTARGAALVTVALVEGEPEGPFPEMELAEALGPHRLLRCRTLSAPEGIDFEDPLDAAVILRGALAAPLR